MKLRSKYAYRRTRQWALAAAASASLLSGCVERRMTITSDPPNALVYLNGEEIGRTPIERDFLFYGNYDVVVRKEGYETLKTSRQVKAPWWQYPPIDLFAELLPWHPTDRQSISVAMTPAKPSDAPPEEIVGRANALRTLIEGTSAPTTRP
ncbi:MAG TPA: PEGA domain-containing protein [Tepidisphaeraceae bacterium]